MRACHDCKHFGYFGLDPAEACARPLSDRLDPVSGRHSDLLCVSPWSERRNDKSLLGRIKCGPAARFFEAAPPAIRAACKECGR